ncbi:hypothetical protein SDC9_125564 [bioreactor metagenome]|uniref:Uncharacterized protein n=1 Tax=bioreactor metagenome TaxID=1076179 RepID=A0A645CNN0_9ZZZZ
MGARFVETHITCNENIYSTQGRNSLFVSFTITVNIFFCYLSVQTIYVIGRNINIVKKVFFQKTIVTL